MPRTVERRIVAATLLLLAGGCHESQTGTGPSAGAVSIRGRALAFPSLAGLPGAVVQFQGGPAGEIRATADASGFYTLSLPMAGTFTVLVDGAYAGIARVTGSAYRGDLLVDKGTCVSRYGTLADARTLRPVAGATVTLGAATSVSDATGWYRIDLDCPSTGTIGFNTTFLYVSHPSYAPRQQVVGRGIHGVQRFDLDLDKN